jgi:type III secretory pathway component EscU
MKKIVRIFTLVFMASMFAIGIVYANDAVPIPITAEQAFDAYANQEDPVTG